MYKLFFLVTILILTGCNQPKLGGNTQGIKPSWILNPNENNKIGAIGVSSRTHDQKISTQRKLAISRALEELSLQQGVTVEMSVKKKENFKNDRLSTSVDVDSSFQTNNLVTAHIEAAWQDHSTSELYVWMVMDK